MSTTGNDNNDGSLAHPFASLAKAQTAMEGSRITTTYVEGGTYSLATPLTLNQADNGLSFLAYPGQAPVLDGGMAGLGTLVALNGASGVTLQGLTFANTASGGDALNLNGGSDNHVIGNHFTNTGTAIVLTGSSSNVVSGNQIDQSAQSAIEARDGSDGNLFDSNLINGTGALGTTGGGFFLHGVDGNVISHNQVENTAGMGIGISNWDQDTINVGNVVDYNVVRNTNTASVDSGAIYMLGRSHVDTQASIVGNLIDGTGAAENHTIGIYLDDSTSGVTVTGNIVRNIGTDGVQIHGGDDNAVQGNIFDLGSAGAGVALFQAAPANTNPTNTMLGNSLTGNIVYSTSHAPHLFDYIDGGHPDISDNLYYDLTGAAMLTGGSTRDTTAQSGNPMFADAAAGNYSLQAGSAAALIGFKPIDQGQIGLQPLTAHWY